MDNSKTVPIRKPALNQTKSRQKQVRKWGEDLHYRSLFEQTGESVFIIDLDFRYLAANQQALNLLGYQEEELVGMPVSQIVSLDEPLSANVDEHSNYQERTLKRKDGSTLPVEISTTMVYDADGQPAYIQSIARDITERKLAEQILKRHTRILSVISEATARLLRSSNIQSRIPEVLESLARAMGVSCAAIFEINTFSVKPSVQIQFLWRERETIEPAKALIDFIPSLLAAPGGYFSAKRSDFTIPFSFAAIAVDGTLGSWGFLGLFDEQNDLAWLPSEREAVQTAANLIGAALQRIRYEETIQLSERRNRIVLDAMPDLLLRIDREGHILDYSANPDHPLYIHRDVISGKKLAETWPLEVVQQIIGKENEKSFHASNSVQEFRLPFSNRAYESRLYPIGPDEALVLIRDVTEQAQLSQMKSDFINRASHELRTPLTTAILMTELIREGGAPEELAQYWATLAGELNRQKNLIDSLLMAGRLESGMMKMEIVPLDVLAVLEESVRAIKPIASRRGISIQLTKPSQPVLVKGDKGGLQQVFINLINNAVKFSPEAGFVEVAIQELETEVYISIADHGVGIPPEALPHLFEQFYRARNVTVAEIPGSGIGLYIVKSIVEGLGGTISVESFVGKGTKFTVSLARALQN